VEHIACAGVQSWQSSDQLAAAREYNSPAVSSNHTGKLILHVTTGDLARRQTRTADHTSQSIGLIVA
jgi:hypothetical protein